MSSLVVDLNNDKYDDLVFWNFDNRQHWSDAHEGYILLSDQTSNIENWKKITWAVYFFQWKFFIFKINFLGYSFHKVYSNIIE